MTFPKLADFSSDFRSFTARKAALKDQAITMETEARRLQELRDTGVDPYREIRVQALLNGETVDGGRSVKTQYDAACTSLADLIEAERVVDRELTAARRVAEKRYCESIKPKHDKHMASLCKNLLGAYEDWSELYEIKRAMHNESIGMSGVFDAVPDFLGTPSDRTSDFAVFMRDAQRLGYGKAPKELR